MLYIKRHSSLAGVWREALEGLREADLAESTVEIDCHEEEVDVSVRGVLCGNVHGTRRLQFISVEGIPVEWGALHSAAEKLCKKAFRFQDNHSLTYCSPNSPWTAKHDSDQDGIDASICSGLSP